MKLTHLLDTSIYSQRLRPIPVAETVRRWRQLGDARLCIAAICEAEILYGLQKRDSTRLWQEYHAFLKDRLVVLPVDRNVAGRYARIKVACESMGQPRADFDLLIAATAIAHNLTLATLNFRHFHGIPDLRVEDWG